MPVGAIVPFIPQIIGAGTALAGSLKQNSKAGRSSTSQSHREGATEGILTPRQHRLEKADLNALLDLIQQGPTVPPGALSDFLSTNAKQYNAVMPRLQANFTSRGMGQSGALNQAFQQNEFEKASTGSAGIAKLKQNAYQNWLQAIFGSREFLNPRKVETTEDFQGTGTGPDQSGNILGAGGFALSQFLKQILGGGGNSGNAPPIDLSWPDFGQSPIKPDPGDLTGGLDDSIYAPTFKKIYGLQGN